MKAEQTNSSVVFAGPQPEFNAHASGEVFARPPVFAKRDSPASWLQVTIERIAKLKELEQNWDSYGANPIDHRSIEMAKQLVRGLSTFQFIEAPLITASPGGHAALAWEDAERSLDVEIRTDGVIEFAFMHDSDSTRDNEGIISNPLEIVSLLTQW